MDNAIRMSEVFDSRANMDYFWKAQARSLYKSAQVLRTIRKETFTKSQNLFDTADFLLPELMLWAFALENSLKALLLKTGIKLARSGEFKRSVSTHDLVKIARKARFYVSSEELEILDRLSEMGTWEGRYPIPLSSKKNFLGFEWRWPDDIVIDELIFKIWTELGWDTSGITSQLKSFRVEE